MMRVNLRAGWRTALIGLVLMMASTHARAQGTVCDDGSYLTSPDYDIYDVCTGYNAYEGEVEISMYVWSCLNGSCASGYDTFSQVLVANPGTEYQWEFGFTENSCITGLGCSESSASFSYLVAAALTTVTTVASSGGSCSVAPNCSGGGTPVCSASSFTDPSGTCAPAYTILSLTSRPNTSYPYSCSLQSFQGTTNTQAGYCMVVSASQTNCGGNAVNGWLVLDCRNCNTNNTSALVGCSCAQGCTCGNNANGNCNTPASCLCNCPSGPSLTVTYCSQVAGYYADLGVPGDVRTGSCSQRHGNTKGGQR